MLFLYRVKEAIHVKALWARISILNGMLLVFIVQIHAVQNISLWKVWASIKTANQNYFLLNNKFISLITSIWECMRLILGVV